MEGSRDLAQDRRGCVFFHTDSYSCCSIFIIRGHTGSECSNLEFQVISISTSSWGPFPRFFGAGKRLFRPQFALLFQKAMLDEAVPGLFVSADQDM